MAITINLRYTGKNGDALRFAEEMKNSGTVEKIRAEKGNHATPKAPYFVRSMSDKLYLKARRTSNFYVEGSCIGCGLCAKQCPVQAIEIQNGKPVWIKEHCTLCLRCLHLCPKFSFSTATAKPSSTDSIIIRKNNIDEEKEMKRTQNMISLFLIFMKIGLFTFGGGYAMIPMIQRETVENKKWINDEELLEIIAISESTPGPIAINAATFIGYRVGGFLGALAATIGLVLPSFAIITAVSFVLAEFQNVRWIQYAFNGIRAGVLALIVKALWSMYKQSPKGIFAYLIMLGAFVVTAFLPVNVIFVILFCATAGIVQAMIFDRRDKR